MENRFKIPLSNVLHVQIQKFILSLQGKNKMNSETDRNWMGNLMKFVKVRDRSFVRELFFEKTL